MKFQQIRNATAVLEIGQERLLVDPVLAEVGAFMPFKVFGKGRRRNPLVALPGNVDELLRGITGVLLTHMHHVDHLDPKGLEWIRQSGLPVWTSSLDAPSLAKKGIVPSVIEDGAMGMRVEVVQVSHGRGLFGWMMGPVTGFYLACPGEPSVLLTSDAVLTDKLLADVARLRPDVIVVPAGSANMGIGGDILFSVDELMALAKAAPGRVVFNHLEALDHCPTTRAELRERLQREDLVERTFVPEDGETLELGRSSSDATRDVDLAASFAGKPGLQKWLVNQVAKVMG